MANRRFTQFMYTTHAKPVRIDVAIPIGATGAVGTLVGGTGISAVTRLAAGQYKVRFNDNYQSLLGMNARLASPNTGSSVLIAALTPGLVYTITIVGSATTAQWVTAGVPVGITPAVGVTFLCAATSAGASSAAQLASVSTIGNNVEIIGNPNTTLAPNSSATTGTIGGYVVLQTLAATAAGNTAMVAADPASGSKLYLEFYLNDSSVTGM